MLWFSMSENEPLKTFLGKVDTPPNFRVLLNKKFQQNASKFAIFYIGIRKPIVAFSVFHFVLLCFSPNECPVLCWHREKKIKKHEMKNGKSYFGFLCKTWQILKRFARTFHWAQTLKLGGVSFLLYLKLLLILRVAKLSL